MKFSLYLKFLLGYLIFGIAGFVTIATLSSHLTYDYLIRTRSATLYDEANLIASNYSRFYSGYDIDIQGAYPQLQAVATFLQADIWIVDRNGYIAIDSSGKKTGQTIADFDPTATGNKSSGRYFDSFEYDVLSVSAPITGNYKTYGYIVIHLPMDRVQQSQYQILNIVYITSLIVFVLSLVILAVFHILVYRPLNQINTAAKNYAQGNLKYTIEIHTNDEIGYLAGTLNYMATELSQAEDYQKTFITNISHDFRSPLTSIKGYLEAILDGTIPYEMQNQYLERVISEVARLTKLTGSILTLNSLDAQGHLNRSTFDIKAMIKSICESFEIQCRTKDIVIDLTFSANEHLVYADSSKIEQVLYNLIDNAIKFSHTSGEIYVDVSEKNGKVFISIKDKGIGIPKKDTKKIFKRFYKSDLSRGKDKKGTGLGLSIVKDIIKAHGEHIDVISTEGVGSEFIFSLTKIEE